MTSCSLRRLQELADRQRSPHPAWNASDEGAGWANSLSECQTNTLHDDELFAPTTAGACGQATLTTPSLERKRRRSRMGEQLVRVPNQPLCHFRDLQHRWGMLALLRVSTAPRVIHFQGEVIDRVFGHT